MNKFTRFLMGALALVFVSTSFAAVTYSSTAKTNRMTAVVTSVDAGGAAGKLEIGTAAMASTLCTITLNYSPAGSVAGSVLTLSGFSKTCTAAATGTAAAARIRTSANADVVTGLTVGTTATDIILDSTSITSGQTVTITSFTLTHALLQIFGNRFAANDEVYSLLLRA